MDSLGEERGLGHHTVSSAARINPEYNYYSENYEKAIANAAVPEAVLPNMYIYSFMSDNNGNLNQPEWQDGAREAELTEQNYDRLITLEEFSGEILPRLTSEDNGFQEDYLENYAQAVQNVVIDMTSSLAQTWRTTISPASEMNFYNALNGRKHQFPMYIELSIPTLPVTENSITHMMGTATTSTGMLNSLISSDSSTEIFKCTTSFFKDPNIYRNYRHMVYRAYVMPNIDALINLQGQQSLQLKIAEISGKVYDFDPWMNGVLDDIEAMVVTSQGLERVEGQCARFRDRLMVQAMRNNIMSVAQSRVPSYSEMLSGRKCDNETIAYKLIKKDSEGIVLQTFYLPNTSYANVINFVDTQVKYNKKYKYDLQGYAVVYGAKYRFTTIQNNMPVPYRPEEWEGQPHPRPDDEPIYAVFEVETIPNIKVVEYAIFSDAYNVPTDAQGRRVSRRDDFLTSGVSFPEVKVFDRPPMPPEMQVHPYRNDYQQILINIQPGSGANIGQDAIKFIPLSSVDFAQTIDTAIYQKQFENFDLLYPKLEFKSESDSETKRIEIYRTTEIAANLENYDDAYKSFGSTPYKILDISNDSELPAKEIAKAFDFVDTLTPNLAYYYTCRAVDVHGKKSNPAAIYQVKLNYDKGLYYPTINLFEMSTTNTQLPTKKLARFLEIQAADLQTYVYTSLITNEDGEQQVVSERGVIPQAEHEVSTNHFLIRVSSRDTGRKIDFKLIFTRPPAVNRT